MQFIKTKDKNAYLQLLKDGFPFFRKDEDFYVFINDNLTVFSGDKSKIVYTDQLII